MLWVPRFYLRSFGVWRTLPVSCVSCCDTLVFTSKFFLSPQIVAFVHRAWDGASVWLSRGFVGSSYDRRHRSRRFRIHSLWTASVELADKNPTGFLTPEPSTAVFRVCCGTVISQSSRLSRLSGCLFSLPAPFNRDPASPYQRALSGLPETITQLELQSSSFALTRLFGY